MYSVGSKLISTSQFFSLSPPLFLHRKGTLLKYQNLTFAATWPATDWVEGRSSELFFAEIIPKNSLKTNFFGLVVGFYFTKTSWIGSLWFLRVSHWTRFVAQCPRWVKIFGTAEWTTKFLVGLTNRWQKPGRSYQVLFCCINWSHLGAYVITAPIKLQLIRIRLV